MPEKKYTSASFWDQAKWDADSPRNYWTNNPLINAYANLQMTGNLNAPNTIQWFRDYYLQKLHNVPVDKAASVGCGTGSAERQALDLNLCREMDGFDVSPASLETARKNAEEKGYGHRLNYMKKDLNKETLPDSQYEFILSYGCLHHIENLEFFLDQISTALKPKGLLYFNEYIGPSRFQWKDEHVELVNKIAKLLPPRCLLADHLERLTEEDLLDPSESIRSDEIIPQVERKFELLDVRFYGGIILYPLWAQVVRPEFFLDPFNNEFQAIFKLLILLDECLNKNGEGLFVQAAACKKNAPNAFIQAGKELKNKAPKPQLGDWLQAVPRIPAAPKKTKKYILTKISVMVNNIYRSLQIIKNHGFRTLYRETKEHLKKKYKSP